ncbi:MAG TPA: efflux RND transporter periplasmic adaptor subunit [Bryobacteraceae bacterium]|nr:efflux RND transporter periplasmic adaptor subunit [Bryobacteraceae bacterium]
MTVALLAVYSGCSQTGASTVLSPPVVEVVEVQQGDVPIYSEWIGTLDGYVNADIKAEVSGYLVRQLYTEGSFVSRGQSLFEIDPRPFEAALGEAKGRLAQMEGQLEQARAQLTQAEAQVAVAQANQRRTQLDVDRYTPLIQQQAITQQDFDNATQNNTAALAQLQAARAAVETAKAQIVSTNAAIQAARAAVDTAQINRGFTLLTSPIDGIPGRAQLQVGSLVSPASGTITTVSTLDPIKVYFTVSEQEVIDYTRQFPTAELRQANLRSKDLELILADGSTYPHTGKFEFADRQVDVRTGALQLAGLFPNPGNSLRPGQYGRVRASMNVRKGALLVPQRAVGDLQGIRQVAVVDGDNVVHIRAVKLGETSGSQWIVTDGVKAGERVIVEGLQKVQQGVRVNPQPYRVR